MRLEILPQLPLLEQVQSPDRRALRVINLSNSPICVIFKKIIRLEEGNRDYHYAFYVKENSDENMCSVNFNLDLNAYLCSQENLDKRFVLQPKKSIYCPADHNYVCVRLETKEGALIKGAVHICETRPEKMTILRVLPEDLTKTVPKTEATELCHIGRKSEI